MNNIAPHFSQTYSEARHKFLDALAAHKVAAEHHVHPAARGPDGEVLAMDGGLLGPPGAERLLILTSGTHGVEGYCGSGAQIALLRDADFMSRLSSSGTSLLVIHALNPYGFSHWRRTNEDNIDLNRNFLDHAKPHPPGGAYAEVHPLLVPQQWPPSADNQAAIADYIAQRGLPAWQQALSGGQYAFRDGLFYGGNAPSWSNRTLRTVLRGFAGRTQRMMWIDFHTGLGPYGHGEMIQAGRDDDAELARARAVWGDQVTSVYKGTSTSARLEGLMAFAVYEELPGVEYAGIALEYGTLPMLEVMQALRADNWLALHPEAPEAQRASIKRQLRDAFYCDADDWKAMVIEQARTKSLAALDALA